MKYSLNWIKDFCDITLSLEELSYRLLMLGFEVEGAEEVAGDTVLTVEVTPNRADCLSMRGFAREVAVACGTELKPRELKLAEEPGDPSVEVVIEDPDLCPRYMARAVTSVKNGPCPGWMGARLEAVGLRPIDILVDATNYVQLEVGQPLHAFDRAKIRGGKIIVRRARAGEKMLLLDETELELSPDDMVIADVEGPIALAGVMGGAGSEVGPDTTDVIIECAYFDPKAIRRTSKRYGVETESSYRFERGVDPAGIPYAADRTAELMAAHATGTVVAPAIDAGQTDWLMAPITLRPSRANMLIGCELSSGDMKDILERVYMAVEEGGEDTLAVKPPTFRRDVEREVDVIEEVARAFGYDRVESRLPAGELPQPEHLATEEVEDRFRELMVRAGFFEAYTNSFLSEDSVASDGGSGGAAAVANPITAVHTHLRRFVWPQLVEVAEYNGRQGEAGVALFELGTVFEPAEKWISEFLDLERPGLSEYYHLAAFAGGTPGEESWYGERRGVDFFLLKGALENLAEYFGPVEIVITDGESGETGGTRSGFGISGVWEVEVGACAGRVYELNLEYIGGKSYAFEVDVTPVVAAGPPVAGKFEPPKRFPYVERDLALLVDADLPAGELVRTLEGDDLLESVGIFDVYEGKGIPAGKKSIGVRLRYRADDRTLTDEEANEKREKALGLLKSKYDLELR
ncbi:MAG: phenylalanine--tRNA ligase subunit beta [Candidatus Coatesbacteria bacterium]|nr:MAG: phenylalanine--tRNA ligase subunit beta [Candidatus Coatesbacteria bacterium]